MIQSMTGFGSAQASGEIGVVTIDIKSVNSRYLDLTFRMPDELRLAEMPLREQVSSAISRGKVEVRANFVRAHKDLGVVASQAVIDQVNEAYGRIRSALPDVSPPTFADVLQWSDLHKPAADPSAWLALCRTAATQALSQFIDTRMREGHRLSQVIRDQASAAQAIVAGLKAELPDLLKSQSDRVAKRMREAFDQAVPSGLSHITAAEISERLHAEASLFSLRADVAEELDRLTLHLTELIETLDRADKAVPGTSKTANKGVGKRLDFLFQEMNREANTLGSKAVDMRLTRAAVDLKLLIEQMREQIQNIE